MESYNNVVDEVVNKWANKHHIERSPAPGSSSKRRTRKLKSKERDIRQKKKAKIAGPSDKLYKIRVTK